MRTPHFATSLRPPPLGPVTVQRDPTPLSLIKVDQEVLEPPSKQTFFRLLAGRNPLHPGRRTLADPASIPRRQDCLT